ncbi:MAG: flippase-like domain-containing protein [Bacteroidia bacterium]|nr:MAG: flippase-like domain-containing protein [Bacteroidia bacterium]
MNTSLKRTLQFLLFLSFGIFLIWLSIKDISLLDIQQIKNSFKNAKPVWVSIGVLSIVLSHIARALRWQLLIEPLNYPTQKRNLIFSVFIGYLTNLAIPRLGEIIKCSTLSKYEKIPVEKLLGTIITERVIDIISMLFIFLFTFWLQPNYIKKIYNAITGSQNHQAQITEESNFLLFILIASAVLIMSCFLWMYITGRSINDVRNLFKNFISKLAEGILSISKLKKRAWFIFYSILIWSLYGICGYFGFLTFQEMNIYGLKEALMILCSGSIGMILTPGGIGAYTFVTQKTMELYGANSTVALTYGWLLWIIQTGVILLGGFISMALLPIINKTTIYENKS